MNRIHKRKLLYQLTTHLLEQRGHEKPSDYDIEWDPMEPDSQYAMCYEDVEIILNRLEAMGYELVDKNEPPAPKAYATTTATYASSTGNVRIK